MRPDYYAQSDYLLHLEELLHLLHHLSREIWVHVRNRNLSGVRLLLLALLSLAVGLLLFVLARLTRFVSSPKSVRESYRKMSSNSANRMEAAYFRNRRSLSARCSACMKAPRSIGCPLEFSNAET